MTYGIYTHSTAERIHDIVLGDDGTVHQDGYEPDDTPTWFHAKMVETLLYPDPNETNPSETGYTTAKAHVLKYKDQNDHDMEEVTVEDPEVEVVITNRNPLVFAAKGDYVLVRHIQAEYVLIGVLRGEVDAVLTSTLAAATNVLTGPSTATFKILHPNSSGDLVLTSWEETLTHRYQNIELETGTYITVKRLNGEWRLSGADCDVSTISLGTGDSTLLGTQP